MWFVPNQAGFEIMGLTKVALVTASSAGLGAATAKGLARAGFSIVINYNSNKQKAETVVHDINQIYTQRNIPPLDSSQDAPHSIAIKADMSQKSEIGQLVQQVIDQYGRLDCVVSNQGWTEMRRFEDLDDNMEEDDWDRCYNMNVKSHLFLFHAAKPYLTTTNGSFTTIASLAGVIPSGSSIVCLSTHLPIYILITQHQKIQTKNVLPKNNFPSKLALNPSANHRIKSHTPSPKQHKST